MRFFAICLLASLAFGEQSRVSQHGAHRMEITLERYESGSWKVSIRPWFWIRTTRFVSNSRRIFPGIYM